MEPYLSIGITLVMLSGVMLLCLFAYYCYHYVRAIDDLWMADADCDECPDQWNIEQLKDAGRNFSRLSKRFTLTCCGLIIQLGALLMLLHFKHGW